MHDANGTKLGVGDVIHVPCVIKSLSDHADYCNVTAESVYPRRPDGSKETLTLNTGVVLLLQKAGTAVCIAIVMLAFAGSAAAQDHAQRLAKLEGQYERLQSDVDKVLSNQASAKVREEQLKTDIADLRADMAQLLSQRSTPPLVQTAPMSQPAMVMASPMMSAGYGSMMSASHGRPMMIRRVVRRASGGCN